MGGGRGNTQTLQKELKQLNADELWALIIRLVQHGDYKTTKWIGEVVEGFNFSGDQI